MPARLSSLFDPLVRLLVLAIILASIVPVSGEAVPVARLVLDVAIFLLFLLNGLRLPRGDVLRGMRDARFLLPLVAFVFGLMGLAGWLASGAAQSVLPASIALGFIFLGVLPSTVQSATAYTSIAGGNVAHSVVAAAVLNMLGVFLTAPLIALLGRSDMPGIDLGGLERIGMILILPFVLGQVLQSRLGGFVAERRRLVSLMDRIAIATAVYIAFSSAVRQGIWTMLDPAAWGWLLALVAVMLLVGFAGAWLLGRLLGLERGDQIAFQFAGAQKSIAMGAPLAAVLFTPQVAGLVLLPVLIYHLVQMIVSAPLAARFSRQLS